MNHKYLKNAVTLQLDRKKCKGCGRCVEVCPHGVFVINDQKARLVDRDRCMECGACAKNCPFAAIKVKSGVGCAYAIIFSKLKGKKPECGCSNDNIDCC